MTSGDAAMTTSGRQLPESVPHSDGRLHIESQCHATALGLSLAATELGITSWEALDPGSGAPSHYYAALITSLERALIAGGVVAAPELELPPDDHDADNHHEHADHGDR